MKTSKGRKKIFLLVLSVFFLLTMNVSAASAARLNKKSVSLYAGNTCVLKLIGASGSISWSSSNKAAASVRQDGTVTAKKRGTAKITAKSGGKKYFCRVTVKKPAKDLKLNKTVLNLKEGASVLLKASTSDQSSVTWSSSNPSVAVVNAGAVRAVSPGTAVITVQRADRKKTLKCKVTVVSRAGESALAREYLGLMKKYSNRVVKDTAAGKEWIYSNSSKLNKSTWAQTVDQMNRTGKAYTNCALLIRWGLRDLHIINNANFWGEKGGSITYRGNVKSQLLKHCQIIKVNRTPNALLAEGNLLPGDICTWVDFRHTTVYAGDGLWYDSGRNLPVGDFVNQKGKFVFRSFGPAATIDMNQNTVGHIIRLIK